MEEYQAVISSREISKGIAYYLEMSDPQNYPPFDRAETVRAVNDILQGRSERQLDALLSELEQKGGTYYAGEIKMVRREIQALQRQKSLLGQAYSKSSAKEYRFRMNDSNAQRPLKIINQQLFDWAAKGGFPPDFFRESYFDHVTIYCMPDQTDLNFSVFQDCTFSACRIRQAIFDGTSIYGSEFHSSDIQNATFFKASIAQTHFYDGSLTQTSFQGARLKACNTIDCIMDRVSFLSATLDGCSFGRITSGGIRDLPTAIITQSGATGSECIRNRASIFKELQVVDVGAASARPAPHKHRKPTGPVR